MLVDFEHAPISERLRAVLAFLKQVTLHPEQEQSTQVARARQAGVSEAALVDALYVAALFNAIDRIADALNFSLHGPDGSWYLINIGYRL